MQKHTVLASAIGAFAAIVVSTGAAQANARICRQLQHEARELRQMGSGASRASLERKLNRVEQQVRRSGCSGLRLLFGGHAKRQCQTLRSNMNRLRQKVRGAGRSHSPERRLRTVEANLRRHGCTGRSRNEGVRHTRRGSGYQTLCVRKCDGYYFPIGFTTRKSELKRDQAACKSFYPTGGSELYLRPTGSDNENAMVSIDGEPYGKQPFAFAYRSAYQPACAAMLHAGVRAIESNVRRRVEIDPSAIVPIPVPRPSATTEVAGRGPTASHHSKVDDGHIRVVGPATPYLTAAPAEASIAPLAANVAPKRITPTEAEMSWLDLVSSLLTPAAWAGEDRAEPLASRQRSGVRSAF
jgi:hypothetical protein